MEKSDDDTFTLASLLPADDKVAKLQEQLKEKDKLWLEQFLCAGGIDVLLHSLHFAVKLSELGTGGDNKKEEILNSRESGGTENSPERAFLYISCLKSVLRTDQGFYHFVRKSHYTKTLLRCMVSDETRVKVIVIELLSAISVFPKGGYKIIKKALKDFQKHRKDEHELCFVIEELKSPSVTLEYQRWLLTFINCVLYNESEESRNKIRNYLYEEGFEQILDDLWEHGDDETHIQCSYFENQEEKDFNTERNPDAFDGSFDEVDGTNHIRLDNNKQLKQRAPVNGAVWKSMLLVPYDVFKIFITAIARFLFWVRPGALGTESPESPDGYDEVDWTPPPPFWRDSSPLQGTVWEKHPNAKALLDRAKKPSKAMKSLNWAKIAKLDRNDRNVWTEVVVLDDLIAVNTAALEEHFSLKSPAKARKSIASQKSRISEEIPLDEGRRRRIDIATRKSEIKEAVRELKHGIFKCSVETLEQLLQIIPDEQELEQVKFYPGDKTKFRETENFFMLFVDFPDYKNVIEGCLVQTEFSESSNKLRSRMSAFCVACDNIMKCKSLKQFLRYVLHVGNFINYDKKALSKAVGFSVLDLEKLSDLKSNVNENRTLLHHLVAEIEINDNNNNMGLLQFVDDFQKKESQLVAVCRLDLKVIEDHLRQLREKVEKVQNLKYTSVKEQFYEFCQTSQKTVMELESQQKQLKKKSEEFRIYFCEKEETFDLQEFLNALKQLCERIRNIQVENIQRRKRKTSTPRPATYRHSLTNRFSVATNSTDQTDLEAVLSRPYDRLSSSVRQAQFNRLRKTKSDWNIAVNIMTGADGETF